MASKPMASLLAVVEATIQKHHMLTRNDHILVAVSGGPDSMALLMILLELMADYSGTLSVFHLNHLIRGEEARKDADFVRQVVARHGLDGYFEEFDVPAYMREHRLSLEDAARIIRHGLLEETADRIGANRIALGHQADDQVETFLMHMIRGSGLDGLRSIVPVRGRFIRPLLESRKELILDFLDEHNIKYRIDSSNQDIKIERNRIRHQMIPMLQEYNPQIEETLLRTIELVRADQELMEGMTRDICKGLCVVTEGRIEIPLDALCEQPKAVRRRILRYAIKEIKSDLNDISFRHIELIESNLKSSPLPFVLDLPGALTVTVAKDSVVIGLKREETRLLLKTAKLGIPGTIYLPELECEIVAQIISPIGVDYKRGGDAAFLDADKISKTLYIRNRRDGDIFKPFGMDMFKKLQDFFVDTKVARAQRDYVPIVLDGNDIIWVAGHRIDERFRVTDHTKRIVSLCIIRKHK